MNESKFENVISLGFFCSVALEIERIGFRNFSLPFDWLITADFSKVLELVDNKFNDFLIFDNLYQESDIDPRYYYDCVNKIHFYHDFNEFQPLCEQFDSVKNKYNRRIAKFYTAIKSPTLFIRYITGKEECKFIDENYDSILNRIKSFNKDNYIIFVYDVEYEFSNAKNAYFVPKENNTSNKSFISCNKAMEKYIYENVVVNDDLVCKNLLFTKKRKRKKQFKKYKLIFKNKIKKIFGISLEKTIYFHSKQYSDVFEKIKED